MTNRTQNAYVDGAVGEVIVTGNLAATADHTAYLSASGELSDADQSSSAGSPVPSLVALSVRAGGADGQREFDLGTAQATPNASFTIQLVDGATDGRRTLRCGFPRHRVHGLQRVGTGG